MSPLDVLAAGPYNLFYTLAVAAAAASVFLAGRRRGWNTTHWALATGAWIAAGVIGAMVPHAIFGDAIAYRTSVGAVIIATLVAGAVAWVLGRRPADVLDTTA